MQGASEGGQHPSGDVVTDLNDEPCGLCEDEGDGVEDAEAEGGAGSLQEEVPDCGQTPEGHVGGAARLLLLLLLPVPVHRLVHLGDLPAQLPHPSEPDPHRHTQIHTHKDTDIHRYTHTKTQTYTDTHRHTQTYTDTHTDIHRHTQIHTHKDTDIHRYTHRHTQIHTHKDTDIHRYTQRHRHTQIHTQTYTDIHLSLIHI